MKETSEERAPAKLNGGGSTTLDVSRVFHGSAPEVASTTTNVTSRVRNDALT